MVLSINRVLSSMHRGGFVEKCFEYNQYVVEKEDGD